jgi:hypothetical protein
LGLIVRSEDFVRFRLLDFRLSMLSTFFNIFLSQYVNELFFSVEVQGRKVEGPKTCDFMTLDFQPTKSLRICLRSNR